MRGSVAYTLYLLLLCLRGTSLSLFLSFSLSLFLSFSLSLFLSFSLSLSCARALSLARSLSLTHSRLCALSLSVRAHPRVCMWVCMHAFFIRQSTVYCPASPELRESSPASARCCTPALCRLHICFSASVTRNIFVMIQRSSVHTVAAKHNSD